MKNGNVPDNYDQWLIHDAECNELMGRLPKCDRCKEFIDHMEFEIDGQILCSDCVKAEYGKRV